MRLHSLSMEAFGPFAEPTTIDFDELGADGLFLLHGNTGAGKTTVLDAVSFALFGRVPGARHDARRLHSDHAPATAPRVELTATVGGRRLRVVRYPEHTKTKRDGGTRIVNAKASLSWLDGSGVDLTRIPEINECIGALIGMNADQFFQVVLLPQGEFATFLRAPTDQRQALLEKLFDTSRFGDIEEWLRERAKRAHADFEESQHSLDREVAAIAAVTGCETPAVATQEWASEQLDQARESAELAEKLLAEADEAARRADAALAVARRESELMNRATRAREQLAALDSERDDLASVRAALANARDAAPIAALVAHVDQAQTAYDHATAARLSAESRAGSIERVANVTNTLSWPPAVDDDSNLDAALEQWRRDLAICEPMRIREGNRAHLVAELAAAQAAHAEANTKLDTMLSEREHLPRERDKAIADIDDHHRISSRIDQHESEHKEVVEQLALLRRREALASDVVSANHAVMTCERGLLNAREMTLSIREQRIIGMAAELSANLVAGHACVVCGSLEHPEPAVVADGQRSYTAADEELARDAESLCAEEFSAAREHAAMIAAERDSLEALIGERTVEELTVQQQEVEQAVKELRAQRIPLNELTEQRSAIQTRIDTLAEAITACTSARSLSIERMDRLHKDIATLDADIAELVGEGTIADHHTQLSEAISIGTSLRATRFDAHAAYKVVRQAHDRLQHTAIAAGFADSWQAQEALASVDAMREWEKKLEHAHALRSAAHATLEDPDVAATAMAGAPADIDQMQHQARTARADADRARETRQTARDRRVRLEELCAAFWLTYDAIEPARRADEHLSGLAEVVAGRGANSKRMSLRAYVLAARLEEVVEAASIRLRHMSTGRYEFVHTDGAERRGRRSGLGIDVRDEYTGTTRPTTTLSGGETFCASLALALGLADVVSAESGGRMLDTMFIDEGFGSLDPESLDVVMGVLDDLRAGGRVVGVVSHVDEMRIRIPAQLRVTRTDRGSHAVVGQ